MIQQQLLPVFYSRMRLRPDFDDNEGSGRLLWLMFEGARLLQIILWISNKLLMHMNVPPSANKHVIPITIVMAASNAFTNDPSLQYP